MDTYNDIICYIHLQGTNCTEDVDECVTRPCQNGGSCTNLEGDYQCRCGDGFTGKNCQFRMGVSQCTPNPCPDNLICADNNVGGYYCLRCSGKYHNMCEIFCFNKKAPFFRKMYCCI